jgi:glycosyltransferase involved in cell wall biosynthesis
MKPPVSITIGIAAYNEKRTLPKLLADLATQTIRRGAIKQVIVVSDASTDGTDEIVQNYTQFPTTLIRQKARSGKAAALNVIFDLAKTDVLVIFDADVRLGNTHTIDQMLKVMMEQSADLVGGRVQYRSPRTLMQQILAASCDMKEYMFSKINNGQNIYTCHGRVRAFSKTIYRSLRFKSSLNEDAYSYIYCTNRGGTYAYAPQATVTYTLPKTLRDHIKQSVRFKVSKTDDGFGENIEVRQAYAIPKRLFLSANTKTMFKKPQLLIYYLVSVYTIFVGAFTQTLPQSWDISASSKL